MQKQLFSLAAAAALGSALFAQSAITLEPLTVTSTPLQNTELNAPEAVEVYTQEEIEKAHVQTLYEFLDQQTSLITMPSYGNPLAQKLDLHGYGIGDGYQNIVVTLNGRRMNNIDAVPQLLSSIPPSSVERVEIIKSSGIVTGGDGANAGVINITTKQSDAKEFTLYGGTYGTYSGSFYAGHTSETLSISGSGEGYRNGGARHINAEQDRDEQKMANGRFDISYTPVDAFELRLGAQFTRTDVIYGGPMTKDEYEENPSQPGSAGFGATQQKYDSDALNAGASYAFADAWSLRADLFHEKKKSNFVTYDSVADYAYDSVRAGIDYDADALQFTLGFDGFKGKRTAFGNETSKNNGAGYLMAQLRLGRNTFKAGYRYEEVTYNYEDASTDISDDHTLHGAELGYNIVFTPSQSLFINYAHSYQAPDIDRFFTTTYPAPTYAPVVGFNGFIEPMQADNYSAGYNVITERNKFKISAYFIDLKNEIYYYPDPTYVNAVNTNIDRSHKYGFDFYDRWLITEAWNIALNYNYVRAIIDEERQNGDDFSGNTLPGVSDHNAKVTLTYLPNERTSIALTQLYRSEAYAADDFNNDFSQKQDAYYSTNLALTYAEENYELFAKINNLFNQSNGIWIHDDAIYPVDFTTTAIAGLKLKF
jgi:iron complex outermembrane receptor protein